MYYTFWEFWQTLKNRLDNHTMGGDLQYGRRPKFIGCLRQPVNLMYGIGLKLHTGWHFHRVMLAKVDPRKIRIIPAWVGLYQQSQSNLKSMHSTAKRNEWWIIEQGNNSWPLLIIVFLSNQQSASCCRHMCKECHYIRQNFLGKSQRHDLTWITCAAT